MGQYVVIYTKGNSKPLCNPATFGLCFRFQALTQDMQWYLLVVSQIVQV